MKITLGINTGFATNRFPEPEDWVGVVADELGLDTVQFTADLLNPFLPQAIIAREAEKIRSLCDKKRVRVQTAFTSAFTRVNHLLHPDPDIQRVWLDWFQKFMSPPRTTTRSDFPSENALDRNPRPRPPQARVGEGRDPLCFTHIFRILFSEGFLPV
jgi:hypothetical protein